MILREATRDLHHACEAHPLGQQMVKGSITPQAWADWLAAFAKLHATVDLALPAHMMRRHMLFADFLWLRDEHGVLPRTPAAASLYSCELTTEKHKLGAAYVLHGAHRNGGPVIRKTLSIRGLPSAHTHYDRPAGAKRKIDELAARADLIEPARATFAALLRVMDEVMACSA